MHKDPIVQEVHQIREKLLAECGGDLRKLMDRMVAESAKFTNHGRVRTREELLAIFKARSGNSGQ